jgi:hypothetical protein
MLHEINKVPFLAANGDRALRRRIEDRFVAASEVMAMWKKMRGLNWRKPPF